MVSREDLVEFFLALVEKHDDFIDVALGEFRAGGGGGRARRALDNVLVENICVIPKKRYEGDDERDDRCRDIISA